MSVSSDSEEFYDAEDLTPSRQSRKSKSSKEDDVIPRSDSEGSVFAAETKTNSATEETASSHQLSRSIPNEECQQISEKDDVERKVIESHQGRKRFRELRQRMQTEDEDIGPNNASPPDSQTSSIEGVFAVPPKTLHPFRIIEHDALSLQSMTSLGRVGRILAGFVEASGVGRESLQSGTGSGVHSSGFSLGREESMSETSSLLSQGSHTHISVNTERRMGVAVKAGSAPSLNTSVSQHFPREERQGSLPLQEPDVIASTKGNGKISDVKTADSVAVPVPVAPPRRKKKAKAQAPKTLSTLLMIRTRTKITFHNKTLTTTTLNTRFKEAKKTRLRLRNENTWKRKKDKLMRDSGEAYATAKGKLVPEKSMQSYDHKCQYQCSEISESERKKVFEEFWGLES